MFSSHLASLRRKQRLSQLALSELTGVSQRHISFLESGRAQPGQGAIRKLAAGLNLSYVEVNQLYVRAGLSPPRTTFNLSDAEFEPAERAIKTLIQAHMPNPAIVTLRSGEIIMANEAFDRIIEWAFSGRTPWRRSQFDPDNLYGLTLHPLGLRQFMQNAEEIIPHTIRRLRNAALVDETARSVLTTCLSFDGISSFDGTAEPNGAELASVLIERYIVRGMTLDFVSMVATFGSPEDVTAQELQIELFFPDNDRTKTNLGRIVHPNE